MKPDRRTLWLTILTSVMTLGTGQVVLAQPAQNSTPTIALRLSKPELINDEHADLKVTVNLPTHQEKASLSLVADRGVQINATAASLDNLQGTVIKHFDVSGDRAILRPGEYVISVDLSVGASTSNTVASETVNLKYTRRLQFGFYLAWGIVGVFVGYALRLLTKVLASVPAPAPAPPEGSMPGTNYPVCDQALLRSGVLRYVRPRLSCITRICKDRLGA